MNTIHSIELIYSNPKIRGGRPCIVGTGLRVLDVVMSMHFGNRSPDQIASDYDISLAKVYAALAYYYENKAEIDDDIREDIRIGRELKKEGFGKPENSIFPAPTADEDSYEEIQTAITQAFKDMQAAVDQAFNKDKSAWFHQILKNAPPMFKDKSVLLQAFKDAQAGEVLMEEEFDRPED